MINSCRATDEAIVNLYFLGGEEGRGDRATMQSYQMQMQKTPILSLKTQYMYMWAKKAKQRHSITHFYFPFGTLKSNLACILDFDTPGPKLLLLIFLKEGSHG